MVCRRIAFLFHVWKPCMFYLFDVLNVNLSWTIRWWIDFLLHDQEDTIPCPVSRVALSSQKNVSISTSSAPTVNSSTYFPSKPNSSRDAPVISQLPFSQSQCSIVHIDGTPCGAVAENKYFTVCYLHFMSHSLKILLIGIYHRSEQCFSRVLIG